MAIRAVVFDVGNVLERVEDVDAWLGRWRDRLGMQVDGFKAALGRVDPRGAIGTGGVSEAEHRKGFRYALGLTEADADEFLADMWDWYCGELDEELVGYVAGLRPAYKTGILSNSADGARREEQRRYGFEQLVDTIVYSHEVGLAKPDPRIYALTCERLGVQPEEMVFLDDVATIVESARAFGIQAVRHENTPNSIAAIEAILAAHI